MLAGTATGLLGAGIFSTYDDRLRLTRPGCSRSRRSLPSWFAPGPDRPPLGYHAQPTRWIPAGDFVVLRSVARGQKFVLDTARCPDALAWLGILLRLGRREHPARSASTASQ
jgi:hypothetical protein